MPEWVIQDKLARGSRPGYARERRAPLLASVDQWLTEVKALGVRSIICLLADDQLVLYDDVPGGLISYYEAAGLQVAHVPARDHVCPPLSSAQLDEVSLQFQRLPKPVLIHCSAGMDRTGSAVKHIIANLRHEST